MLWLWLACAATDTPTSTESDTDADTEHTERRSDTEVDTGCDDTPCRLTGEVSLGDADAVIEGPGPDTRLGLGVAGIGDVDGDGHPDFAVGARRAADVGAVYLFTRAPTGTVQTVDAHATLTGLPGSQVGYGLDGVGDVDGDGHLDLVVGDWAWQGTGRAMLVLGPLTGDLDLEAPAWEASGTAENGRFGFTVAGLGDLDHDGFGDFAVSGYLDEGERGRIAVVHGGSALREQVWVGLAERDNAGRGLSGGADLDGDGFGEVVVGARFADTTGSNAGEVYVFAGPATDVASLTEASATLTGDAADNAGWSLDATHDLDGDGYGDLVIGGHHSEHAGGRLWFVHGPVDDGALADAAVAQLLGDTPFDDFARDLDVGDVDGDGLPDVLVGAREASDPGVDAGSAWLCYGPFTGTRELDPELDWLGRALAEGDFAGEDVALPGDLDGDGYGDLLIGAWQADGDNGADAGQAYVFYGLGP